MTGRATIRAFGLAALLCALVFGRVSESAYAQGRPRKGKAPSVKVLDLRFEKARNAFLKEAYNTAKDYEEAGQLEKARSALRQILRLDPNLAAVDAKIKEIDEKLLSSNEVEFEVDVAKGWGTARARVFKDRPFRIQAAGSYKFTASATVGAGGFPAEKPERGEMALGIPCGGLMASIVDTKKPGKPFFVGAAAEIKPKKDGVLFLRVNLPPGSRSTGRIKVRLSGYVLANGARGR